MSGRLSNPFIHTTVTLRPPLPSPLPHAGSSRTSIHVHTVSAVPYRIRCFFVIRRGAESHRHADFVLVTHRSPLSSTVFTPPERCSRCSPAACSGSDTEIHCFSPCPYTENGNKSSYQADIFDKIQRERGKTVHFSPIHAVFSPFDAVFTVFRRFTPKIMDISHRNAPFFHYFGAEHAADPSSTRRVHAEYTRVHSEKRCFYILYRNNDRFCSVIGCF